MSEFSTESFSGLRHKIKKWWLKPFFFFFFFGRKQTTLSQSIRLGLLKINRLQGAAPVCNSFDPTMLSTETMLPAGQRSSSPVLDHEWNEFRDLRTPTNPSAHWPGLLTVTAMPQAVSESSGAEVIRGAVCSPLLFPSSLAPSPLCTPVPGQRCVRQMFQEELSSHTVSPRWVCPAVLFHL